MSTVLRRGNPDCQRRESARLHVQPPERVIDGAVEAAGFGRGAAATFGGEGSGAGSGRAAVAVACRVSAGGAAGARSTGEERARGSAAAVSAPGGVRASQFAVSIAATRADDMVMTTAVV